MNRKLLNGFLAAAMVFGAAGMMSSCKDNDEDMRNDILSKMNTSLESCKTTCAANLAALKTELESAKSDLQSQIDALGENQAEEFVQVSQDIAVINSTLTDITGALANQDAQLGTLSSTLAQAQGKIETLSTDLDSLQSYAAGLDMELMSQIYRINELYGMAEGYLERLEAAEEAINAFDIKFTEYGDSIADLKERMAYIEDYAAGLDVAIQDVWLQIEEINARLNQCVTMEEFNQYQQTVELRFQAVEDQVATLQQKFDALDGRLNKLITSIICQATYNPVFGTISLPFDLRSNILLSYYSKPGISGSFPGTKGAVEDIDHQKVNAAALARVAEVMGSVPEFDYSTGDIFTSKNAGTVYLTLNPQGHDFDGVKVELVRSDGEATGVELSAIEPSEDLVTFGFTYGGGRSADNGFYAATAKITSYNACKVDIEDGLKAAAKEVLQDRSKSSLVNLANTLYNQFNGILPALALRAPWTVNGVDYSVISQYNIAATAFSPLSYNFLADYSADRTIPVITPISEISLDEILENLPEFKLDGVSININYCEIGKIEISPIEFEIDEERLTYEYYIYVPALGNVPVTGTVGGFDEFLDELTSKLNEVVDQIDGINDVLDDVQKDINTMVDEINQQFDNIISTLEADVNTYIKDAIESVAGQYVDKLNGFLGKFNDFTAKLNNAIEKINGVLTNPNHYLQVTMLYEANGAYHQLSNSAALPSQARINGGNAIVLFPTSYTAEILAPSYKKYVAVSKVWANGDATRTNVASVMKDANDQTYMNEISDGGRLSVPLKVQAGYTYEIIYSALDYQGYSSTRRFYLEVK